MDHSNWPERDFVRADFLANVLVTAAVDGMEGWAEVQELYFKEWGGNLMWAHVEIQDTKGDDPDDIMLVIPDVIEQGMQDILNGEVQVADSLRTTLAVASASNRSGDIDAMLADRIVQAGLLGSVVYE